MDAKQASEKPKPNQHAKVLVDHCDIVTSVHFTSNSVQGNRHEKCYREILHRQYYWYKFVHRLIKVPKPGQYGGKNSYRKDPDPLHYVDKGLASENAYTFQICIQKNRE